MIDEDLRALERAAGSGDGLAVLRYAEALRRTGRERDSLAALSRGHFDAAVFAEIRRIAGPPGGSPDSSYWSPIAAIDTAPRLKWERTLAPTHGIDALLGNAFGLVATSRSGADSNEWLVYFLDPDTGDFRRLPLEISADFVETVVVDDAVLLRARSSAARRLVVHDIVTGGRRWEAPGSDAAFDRAVADAREVSPLESHPRFEAPIRCWGGDWPPVGLMRREPGRSAFVAGEGPSAREVWATTLRNWGDWHSPEFAVTFVSADDHDALVVIGRDGELGRLRCPERDPFRGVFMSAETIYAMFAHRLVAFDRHGERLWELPCGSLSGAVRILPLPGRIVCTAIPTGSSNFYCLEQPDYRRR